LLTLSEAVAPAQSKGGATQFTSGKYAFKHRKPTINGITILLILLKIWFVV
jgi:hypothetical protein